MHWDDWLKELLGNAAFTAALLAIAGWLGRTWIKERLAASIRTQTETKLTSLRDQLHRETETQLTELRTRLNAAESKLTEARKAGIDANQQLYAAVVPEQIAGIKAMWAAIRDARAINVVSMFVSVMDLDMVRREIRNHALAERLWQINSELSLVQTTATPEIAAQYAANAYAGTQPFLSYVEKELLEEFERRCLKGKHSGPEAAQRAADIIRVTETVAAANTAAQAPV